MSSLRVVKCETTQVAGGALDVYGFTISTHSATDEFHELGSVNIDTTTFTADELNTWTDFLAIINAKLLES